MRSMFAAPCERATNAEGYIIALHNDIRRTATAIGHARQKYPLLVPDRPFFRDGSRHVCPARQAGADKPWHLPFLLLSAGRNAT
jgi:hypothetical protein